MAKKKKSNAEALAEGIVNVLSPLSDPEFGGSVEDLMPTVISMIEEVLEVETKKSKGKGGNKAEIRKECVDAICPLCKKGVEIIQWSKHLIKKNGIGPGVHQTAPCLAVNIRLLDREK